MKSGWVVFKPWDCWRAYATIPNQAEVLFRGSLELCGFIMLSYPKVKELVLSRPLARLQDLDFCSVQIFSSFRSYKDQGFRLPLIHGTFARWSRKRSSTCSTDWGKRQIGSWSLEVVQGYLKADRSFIVLLSRDSIAYISLCRNIRKSHLLQVLLLLINTFRHSFIQHMKHHFQFSFQLLHWFQNPSCNFTYQCWI